MFIGEKISSYLSNAYIQFFGSKVKQDVDLVGQQIYFDIGSFPAWDFMNWQSSPPKMDSVKLNSYLTSLFDQFSNCKLNKIYLSFSQFNDIDHLLHGGCNNPADSIATLISQYPGTLEQIIQTAHQYNIQVDLSIGGENASGMVICKKGEKPQSQAQKFVQFMNRYNIDCIDFDLEDSGAVSFVKYNSTRTIQTFFQTLHQELAKVGKSTTLTIEGSIHNWPQGYLKSLFYDRGNKPIFNDLFDGLNLMLYGNQFYLDIGGDWGIESWLQIVGQENAGKIHVGFQDGIDYSNLSKNWAPEQPGEPCPWTVKPNSSSGSAAAQIYYQLEQRLSADGFATPLGEPFWWPDRGGGGTADRYAPTQSGLSQFGLQVEQDFWSELNALRNQNLAIKAPIQGLKV